MKRIIILVLWLVFAIGCSGITNMTKLDPSHYPLSVRNGDIIDKYMYDETYIPLNPMYCRIFGRDY